MIIFLQLPDAIGTDNDTDTYATCSTDGSQDDSGDDDGSMLYAAKNNKLFWVLLFAGILQVNSWSSRFECTIRYLLLLLLK